MVKKSESFDGWKWEMKFQLVEGNLGGICFCVGGCVI